MMSGDDALELLAQAAGKILPASVDPTRIPIECDPTQMRMRGYTAHKGMHFNVPFISQITDNLWQGGCEQGLILPSFIEHIVSLYPWEKYSILHSIETQLYVKMYDSLSQGMEQVEELAYWVAARVQEGPTLVHCQAGLNRSSLVAGTAMVRHLGFSPKGAIAILREKRSPAVLCNDAFEEFILSLEAECPEPS